MGEMVLDDEDCAIKITPSTKMQLEADGESTTATQLKPK
jgi:hypothetical protein